MEEGEQKVIKERINEEKQGGKEEGLKENEKKD